ncbi:hypothetical protein Peur_010463 [Populus x canadensis]
MELARDLAGLSTDLNGLSNQNAGNNSKAELMESKHRALSSKKERERPRSSEATSTSNDVQHAKDESPMEKISSLSDIENKGATLLSKEDLASLGGANPSPPLSSSQTQVHGDAETLNYHQDTLSVASNNEPHKLSGEPDDESQKPTDLTDGSNMLSLVCEENAVLKPEQNEAMVTQHEEKDENSQ